MTSVDAIVRGAAYAAGGVATAGCLYLLATMVLVLRFRRGTAPGGPDSAPAVTVLVPLCGDEPGLARRLRSLRRQVYPAPVEIICGVLDETDEALPPARLVADEANGWPLAVHVDPRRHGRNLKISNLANLAQHACHAVLVMIDSDMEVAPDYLARVVRESSGADVGAVTCLYHGVAEGGLPARLSATGINQHFLPNAVFGLAAGIAHPCFGATIALSRDTLARIGGLAAFADQLWDDYAIGHAVRMTGRRVAIADFAPAHVCTEPSARRLLATQLRAARTVRGIDPVGHAGGFVTHPLAFALLALCLSWTWWALAAVLVALGCRTALALAVSRRFGAPRPALALVPVSDLLSFAIHVASYLSATVEWRGQRYRIKPNGTLTPTANRG